MTAPGTAARAAALEILRATRSGELFDVARDRVVRGLDERDARLAQEIAAGVLRAKRGLDARVRRLVADRWRSTPAELRDVLRIGAYQLTALSRVPPHAAVDTAVELARARHGAKSGAFVNAVLRNLLRKQPAGESAAGEPRADTLAQRLAARHSHPDWLVARWLRHFGREATERLLAHNNRRPPLYLRPARWTLEELQVAATQAGLEAAAPRETPGLFVRARHPRSVPGFESGAFVAQGPAQARLLDAAALASGLRVWDACAAPGGKTAVLAQTQRVIASDRARARLHRVRETLDRVAPTVPVVAADARQPPIRPGAVDAVWLDAPCSATGTMAQHPDARWRVTPRRLAELTRLQQALLDGVATVLASGGLLVYTTCSLEPEENEVQVDGFLGRYATFRRDRSDVFIFPPDTGADGGYLAVLRRR